MLYFSRMRRYINLTKTERITLSEGYKNHSNRHFRQRCQALLLSDSGHSCKDLSAFFSVRSRTIYTWMNRWEQKGVVGLMNRKGQGRPPLLKITDVQTVGIVKKK
ncbi:MAG: helix-turn-helix domain-containing protein [Chitinophagales bacterium]